MRSAILASLVAILACSANPSSQKSEQEMLRASAASVVQVDIAGGGHGSGVVISSTRLIDGTYGTSILTARHVVDGGEALSVLGFVVLNSNCNLSLDAAVIYVRLPMQLPCMQLRSEPVLVGETLYGIGFSGRGNELWITRGLASASDRGGSAAMGDSGGAMVDSEGRLIGVISSIDSYGMSIYLWHHCTFVPVADLSAWLSEVVR